MDKSEIESVAKSQYKHLSSGNVGLFKKYKNPTQFEQVVLQAFPKIILFYCAFTATSRKTGNENSLLFGFYVAKRNILGRWITIGSPDQSFGVFKSFQFTDTSFKKDGPSNLEHALSSHEPVVALYYELPSFTLTDVVAGDD